MNPDLASATGPETLEQEYAEICSPDGLQERYNGAQSCTFVFEM
jgi:hypothetical protein